MSSAVDYLGSILERKQRENARRVRHARRHADLDPTLPLAPARAELAYARLQRPAGAALRAIAEIKLRSPSAGLIRARRSGLVENLARSYAEGGAAAISVLCDGPGFGGSVLDLRRVARTVEVPLLFKEFVLAPLQVRLAREVGAHMVLLLVRALPQPELHALVDSVLAHGMAPVVEAADEAELERALATRARIVGVNARDLRSFHLDTERARAAIARVPSGRIAVLMSGIRSAEDFARAAATRADAVLIGEGLMRSEAPAALLREWLLRA